MKHVVMVLTLFFLFIVIPQLRAESETDEASELQQAQLTDFAFLKYPSMVECPGFEYISLWNFTKPMRDPQYFMLTVAQVADAPKWRNSRTLSMDLKLIAPLRPREQFKKITVEARGLIFIQQVPTYKSDIAKLITPGKYYVFFLKNNKAFQGEEWPADGWRFFSALRLIPCYGMKQFPYRDLIAMPISGPDAPVLKAVKALLINLKADDKAEKLPPLALEYLQSPEQEVRHFTARMAAAGELGFGPKTSAKLRNAYAQRILDAKDPFMQTTLARGYYQAARSKKPYYPDDPKLMRKLLALKNRSCVHQVVLGFAFPSLDLETYSPYIEHLLADQERPTVRGAMLYAMRRWVSKAKPFATSLMKIAQNRKGYLSNKANAFDRIAAFELLKAMKAEGLKPIADKIINEIPSAAILNDMVQNNDRSCIPLIIQAIEKKKYPLTPAVRLTLVVLSSYHQIETFDDVMAWWKPIRDSKDYDAMIKCGFLSAKQQAHAYTLADQLGSPEFVKRKLAKAGLIKMGLPVPEALYKAAALDDPEIALAAEQIIKVLQSPEIPYRKKLAELARTEIETGRINWTVYPKPTSKAQPTE